MRNKWIIPVLIPIVCCQFGLGTILWTILTRPCSCCYYSSILATLPHDDFCLKLMPNVNSAEREPCFAILIESVEKLRINQPRH